MTDDAASRPDTERPRTEPSWLGNAVGGVVTAGILGLPLVVFDQHTTVWLRVVAGLAWLLCVATTAYYLLRGFKIRVRVSRSWIAAGGVAGCLGLYVGLMGWTLPSFLSRSVPIWQAIATPVGAGLTWVLLRTLSRRQKARIVDLVADLGEAQEDVHRKVALLFAEDQRKMLLAHEAELEAMRTALAKKDAEITKLVAHLAPSALPWEAQLWDAIPFEARLLLHEIHNKADTFLFNSEAEALRRPWTRGRWNAIVHRLTKDGLIRQDERATGQQYFDPDLDEQVDALARGWALTDQGRDLMAWVEINRPRNEDPSA